MGNVLLFVNVKYVMLHDNILQGRSQVDAEDPNFLHEQMQFVEKSRKDAQYSREKDIKFTPLRRIINFFSILILLIGLGHIISSGKLIKELSINILLTWFLNMT